MKSTLPVALCVWWLGCTPPLTTPGVTGATPIRDDDRPPPRDATSLALAKGQLHLVHAVDAVASCGGECALKSKSRSIVTLELAPNGVAALTDEGATIERFRSAAGSTKHLTEWRRSFTGSWTEGDQELKLRLDAKEATCTRTSGNGEPEQPCDAPSALELTCRTVKLKVRSGGKKARAWVCATSRPGNNAATPAPWAFGIEQTLRSSDEIRGHQARRTYARYEPSPPSTK
jgi:hypothetical protein